MFWYKNKKTGERKKTDKKITDSDWILVGVFRDAHIKSNDNKVIKK